MADKKISEFPIFPGIQDEQTYYIVSSGEAGISDSANYKVPFTDLSDAILSQSATLISAESADIGILSAGTGNFTSELLVSGQPVLTGFEIPGGGQVIEGGDTDISFGGTDQDDNREVNFQQGGETKLSINENGGVEVTNEFIVEGESSLSSTTVDGSFFETKSTTNSSFGGPVEFTNTTTIKDTLTVEPGKTTTLGLSLIHISEPTRPY